MSGTTKAQVAEIVNEVEVLCRLAATNVRSHAPIGLGESYAREAEALGQLLEEIPRRFTQMMRKGQRTGWAAK